MGSISELYVVLTAETSQFKAKMAEAGAVADETSTGMNAKFLTVGLGIAAVGIAVAAKATDMWMNWQTSTDKIAQMTGQTTDQAAILGNAFLTIGNNGVFSGNEIVQAYAPVAGQLQFLNGGIMTVQQSLDLMNTSQDLANATGTSLSDTTSTLATVMQAYKMNTSDAAGASDTLFNISRVTGLSLDDIAGYVDQLHQKMGPLAPSLENVGTLLVDLKENGGGSGRSILQVAMAMDGLMKPTGAAATELSNLGVSLYNTDGSVKSSTQILSELSPKITGLKDPTAEMAALTELFGTKAGAMYSVIQGGQGTLTTAATQVTAVGTAHTAAGIVQDSAKGKWDSWIAQMGDGAQIIANNIGPGIVNTFQTVGDQLPRGWQRVQDAFWGWIDQMHNGWGVIGDFIGGIVNDIIGALDKVIGGMNSLGGLHIPLIPGVSIGSGQATIQMPGRRAGGGPVDAYGAYIVGENGPELLQMGGAGGNVVPNGQFGSGGTSFGDVTIVVQGSSDPQATALAVRDALLRLAKGRGVPSLMGGY